MSLANKKTVPGIPVSIINDEPISFKINLGILKLRQALLQGGAELFEDLLMDQSILSHLILSAFCWCLNLMST